MRKSVFGPEFETDGDTINIVVQKKEELPDVRCDTEQTQIVSRGLPQENSHNKTKLSHCFNSVSGITEMWATTNKT